MFCGIFYLLISNYGTGTKPVHDLIEHDCVSKEVILIACQKKKKKKKKPSRICGSYIWAPKARSNQ